MPGTSQAYVGRDIVDIHFPYSDNEFITGIAVITPDDKVWFMPRPYRHFDLVKKIRNESGYKSGFIKEQGFTTNLRRFVDRYEARVVARNAGQLLLTVHPGKFLWSEDIW